MVHAIVVGDVATALRLLAAQPALASARVEVGAIRQCAKAHYLNEIEHYLYAATLQCTSPPLPTGERWCES
jgi:hypothetical protein